MERLTNHFDYCKMIDCKYYDAELFKQGKCKFFDNSIEHCHEKRINDKLREYEDLEENGLLLKLPCKIGDIVYNLTFSNCRRSGYRTDKIKEIIIKNDEVLLFFYTGLGKNINSLGSTMFLTAEEAEEVLAKIR